MNRNTNSRFATLPSVNMNRSKFPRTQRHIMSFNVGDLVPIYLNQDILPGDTIQIDTHKLVRMQTLMNPILDDLYLDTYYFFVPYRILWSHMKEFFGENTTGHWTQLEDYEIPQFKAPNGVAVGSVADHLGVPSGVNFDENHSVSALPFRAYAMICNEWFRDQNLTDPLLINTGDTITTYDVDDSAKGGMPFKVAKLHDYFTSCLPGPQKGPDVEIQSLIGELNVVGNGKNLAITDGTALQGLYLGNTKGLENNAYKFGGLTPNDGSGGTPGISLSAGIGVPTKDQLGETLSNSGLIALSNGSAISVNALRLAFQMQKFYEAQALYGSRYREMVYSMFGTHTSDKSMQIPEYLGGNRIRLNINQVIQSSSTNGQSTPLGYTGAFSVTGDSHSDFTYSATEHGIIMGVACVRYNHTYQQGLERGWKRKSIFDFYWPKLANIGNQPVYKSEIMFTGTDTDDDVFGYQEAWADYRYSKPYTSGEMSSLAPQPLDSWHLGDDYEAVPTLSDEWIREDKANVDRVLAVTSENSNQLFGDFEVQCQMTRVMPLYSVPGLLDHH